MARAIRNEDDYDDWEVGMEPIPGDTSWVNTSSVLHLHTQLSQRFRESETVDYDKLSAIAVISILSLPPETLMRLARTFTP